MELVTAGALFRCPGNRARVGRDWTFLELGSVPLPVLTARIDRFIAEGLTVAVLSNDEKADVSDLAEGILALFAADS